MFINCESKESCALPADKLCRCCSGVYVRVIVEECNRAAPGVEWICWQLVRGCACMITQMNVHAERIMRARGIISWR